VFQADVNPLDRIGTLEVSIAFTALHISSAKQLKTNDREFGTKCAISNCEVGGPMITTEMMETRENERREKARFPLERELRYKVLKDKSIVAQGVGTTENMGSGGVAFVLDHFLAPGSYVELSISWPVLLEGSCPMRLVAFGRVLRSDNGRCACTIDKYEFRTQARALTATASAGVRNDAMLQRWAEGFRKTTTLRATMA
jgi:hypothetical protein